MSGTPVSPALMLHVLTSVCRAFLANRTGNNRWIPLPPVAERKDTLLSMDALVARIDRIVRLVIKNTAHPCLYYSYARCRVLRRMGYPVQLNMGMHNLNGTQDAEGHCWLSLEGKALFEEKDPSGMYSDRLGERGDVIYWARLKDDEGKRYMRVKKE